MLLPRLYAKSLSLLLASVLAAPLQASETGVPAAMQPMPDSREVGAYREIIGNIESEYGAYSGALPEQMLSLGHALQRQGRHGEAVKVLKRGTHLARINDGLYSGMQIPLIRAQIASHVALGEMQEADERQYYLYRVQIRALDAGEARAQALMQQAMWQHDAYTLGLGDNDYTRLMSMWDLYRLALTDIAERKGETSLDLLTPLYGMLRAQYLIADYDMSSGYSYEGDGDYVSRQQYNRFNAYRAQSFDKGSAVLRAIYKIEQQNVQPGSAPATARALAELGDWYLWHGEREEALASYATAHGELVERDDAQVQIDQLFGAPKALPTLEGVAILPSALPEGEGNLLLEFSVTPRGQVTSLERLDESEGIDGKANRLMRRLRKSVFRPRFEAGEPVLTEQVRRSYAIGD